MFWVQVGACFALWIAYAIQSRKLVPLMRKRLEQMNRTQKVVRGAVAIVLSLVVLLAGLMLLAQAGAIREGQLTWWGVPGVALVGLAFIHFQALATASMVSVLAGSRPERGRPPETQSAEHSSKSPRQADE